MLSKLVAVIRLSQTRLEVTGALAPGLFGFFKKNDLPPEKICIKKILFSRRAVVARNKTNQGEYDY
jgi:hypothetical protein